MADIEKITEREVQNQLRKCIKKIQRSTDLDKDEKKMIRTALENVRGQRPEMHMLDGGHPIYSCRMCGKIVKKPPQDMNWTYCWSCGAMQIWEGWRAWTTTS